MAVTILGKSFNRYYIYNAYYPHRIRVHTDAPLSGGRINAVVRFKDYDNNVLKEMSMRLFVDDINVAQLNVGALLRQWWKGQRIDIFPDVSRPVFVPRPDLAPRVEFVFKDTNDTKSTSGCFIFEPELRAMHYQDELLMPERVARYTAVGGQAVDREAKIYAGASHQWFVVPMIFKDSRTVKEKNSGVTADVSCGLWHFVDNDAYTSGTFTIIDNDTNDTIFAYDFPIKTIACSNTEPVLYIKFFYGCGFFDFAKRVEVKVTDDKDKPELFYNERPQRDDMVAYFENRGTSRRVEVAITNLTDDEVRLMQMLFRAERVWLYDFYRWAPAQVLDKSFVMDSRDVVTAVRMTIEKVNLYGY